MTEDFKSIVKDYQGTKNRGESVLNIFGQFWPIRIPTGGTEKYCSVLISLKKTGNFRIRPWCKKLSLNSWRKKSLENKVCPNGLCFSSIPSPNFLMPRMESELFKEEPTNNWRRWIEILKRDIRREFIVKLEFEDRENVKTYNRFPHFAVRKMPPQVSK